MSDVDYQIYRDVYEYPPTWMNNMGMYILHVYEKFGGAKKIGLTCNKFDLGTFLTIQWF